MTNATKTKYEEILDGMVDDLTDHLESLPKEERIKRVKAVAAYSFDAPQRSARAS